MGGTTSILRKNYNGGKNRYNGGGSKGEKMATRGGKGWWSKKEGQVRSGRRGRAEGGLRSANSSSTRRPAGLAGSRPRRAISSFILINNACQESGRGGGASPGHGNNPATFATRFQRRRIIPISRKLDLILRGGGGEKGRGREKN